MPYRLFIPLLLLTVWSCQSTAEETSSPQFEGLAAAVEPSSAMPEWAKDAAIYEVNIRQHTPEGTFAAFTQDLERIANLGTDILWLMPIFPISEAKRKGPLGSPYAVSDYTTVNPEFGTEADFQALVDGAHALGMRVILDYVPNHTGWDHAWITEHPEYYTQNEAGEIIALASGGTGIYTYTLNDVDYGDTNIFIVTESGVYVVVVTDSAGCQAVAQIDIETMLIIFLLSELE